jgi:hypothetical protein
MATGRQLKAAIFVRRAAKGPRKKRTRPEALQYTVAEAIMHGQAISFGSARPNSWRQWWSFCFSSWVRRDRPALMISGLWT